MNWDENIPKRILGILDNSSEPCSTEYLSEQTGFGVAALRRVLNRFAMANLVRKHQQPGEAITWTLNRDRR